jgi:Amt family ammonium transporter
MLMTPGLAFFYGGMVRKKNILSVLMQCFIILCLISVQWVVYGYSLSFGPGEGFWGGFGWLGLKESAWNRTRLFRYDPSPGFHDLSGHVRYHNPCVDHRAFAERMKFSAFLAFILLWATFVYDPVCHWVWAIGDG